MPRVADAEPRYEARGFVVERQTNMAALRKRYYGVNPKHWERISAGLDTDHVVYSIETIAKSAEGHEVSCRLMGGRCKASGCLYGPGWGGIPGAF